MNAEDISRFPLQWPSGWKRTDPAARRPARFHGFSQTQDGAGARWRRKRCLTISEALGRLQAELDRLGASQPVLSSNLVLRLDLLPRSGQRDPIDPGAAVYFRLSRKPRCLACDRWDSVADNIAAIAAHISAIRAVDRYGVGTLDQAFAGYAQLPPSAEEWWIVLGVPRESTDDEIDQAYRDLARKHHPDVGGDPTQMARINQAREAARGRG